MTIEVTIDRQNISLNVERVRMIRLDRRNTGIGWGYAKNLASDLKTKECIECWDQKKEKKPVDFHYGAVRNSSIC